MTISFLSQVTANARPVEVRGALRAGDGVRSDSNNVPVDEEVWSLLITTIGPRRVGWERVRGLGSTLNRSCREGRLRRLSLIGRAV